MTRAINGPYFRNEKTFKVLLSIAFSLFLGTGVVIYPLVVPLKATLGLVSVLPLAYWVGFVFLCASIVFLFLHRPRNDGPYLVTLGVLAFSFIFPVLLEPNPRFIDSYWPLGVIRALLLPRHSLDIGSIGTFESLPAYGLLASSLTLLSGANLIEIAKFFPAFWGLAFAIFPYATAKRFGLPPQASFTASALALSAFWFPQTYFQPRVIALLLSVFSLMLIPPTKPKVHYGLLALVSVALCLTETTTDIAAFAIPWMLVTIARYGASSRTLRTAAIVCGPAIAWPLFTGVSSILPSFYSFFLNELSGQTVSALVTSAVPTTLQRTIVAGFRYYYIVGLAMLALVATVFVLRRRGTDMAQRNIRVLLLWLVGSNVFAWYNYGGTPFYLLSASFSVVPIALMTVNVLTWNRTRTVVCVSLLILFIVPHMFATYSTESTDQIRSVELDMASFYATYASSSLSYYTQVPQLVYYYNPVLSFKGEAVSFNPDSAIDFGSLSVILLDAQSHAALIYGYGTDPVTNWVSGHPNSYNQVYANGQDNVLFRLG